jgi:hypothetical protein
LAIPKRFIPARSASWGWVSPAASRSCRNRSPKAGTFTTSPLPDVATPSLSIAQLC